jgi:histidinol-phosphate phosphatase family domain/HAD-superfamily hydrolase, subfamily IIIA
MSAIKALVLDRDGTLIEHVPYLHKPEEVRVLPGVREALATARAAGVKLFLHTNQSGVGRGLFTVADAEACTARMVELLDLGPDLFARICTAPEHPKDPAVYRKPSPRFAREIMAEFGLQPQEICYIGDRGSDVETGHAAGTRAVGVATGLDDLAAELREAGLGQYPIFPSFREAVDHVLSWSE